MSIVQRREKTYRATRDIAIQLLKQVVEETEAEDWVEKTEIALGDLKQIDTTSTNIYRLKNDPKLQKAFEKFLTNCIGTMQFLGDE